jgi:hypothetical protein
MEQLMQIKQDRPAPLKIQYGQGYYAFSRGWLVNQYEADTTAGKEWQRGFDRAYFDNLNYIRQ